MAALHGQRTAKAYRLIKPKASYFNAYFLADTYYSLLNSRSGIHKLGVPRLWAWSGRHVLSMPEPTQHKMVVPLYNFLAPPPTLVVRLLTHDARAVASVLPAT